MYPLLLDVYVKLYYSMKIENYNVHLFLGTYCVSKGLIKCREGLLCLVESQQAISIYSYQL